MYSAIPCWMIYLATFKGMHKPYTTGSLSHKSNRMNQDSTAQTASQERPHPFADLLGLTVDSRGNGKCECSLKFNEKFLNPNDIVHGGVIYSLADNGMGGALQSVLDEDELCATIELKITYLHAAGHHDLLCKSIVLKKGRRVAMLESEIYSGGKMVAKATGSFAVFHAKT